MIILDENQLTNGTLSMIGQDYDMEMPDITDQEAFYNYIESIVERFYFDVDYFKEELVKLVKENIKIEIKEKK